MKNILKLYKLNFYTYLFIIICFLSGYIKEIITIMIIISFHEFGHVFISRFYNYEILEVKLYPCGGITKTDKKINCPINNDLVIYMSGIVFQVLLLALLYILFLLNIVSGSYYHMFKYYNQTILLFNLLIIYPLDGFFIIKLLLEKYLSYYYTNTIMIVISFIFLFSFSIYSIFQHNNYFMLLFLLYQNILYIKSIKKLYNRFLLERFLYNNNYNKIIYHNYCNLKLLRKECYHFFKQKSHLVNEKALLDKKFDINVGF